MVAGFIPASLHLPSGIVLSWMEGDPEKGLPLGFFSDWYYPIQALRCPKCGLIQLYATKRK
jgi:hypothetical protein